MVHEQWPRGNKRRRKSGEGCGASSGGIILYMRKRSRGHRSSHFPFLPSAEHFFTGPAMTAPSSLRHAASFCVPFSRRSAGRVTVGPTRISSRAAKCRRRCWRATGCPWRCRSSQGPTGQRPRRGWAGRKRWTTGGPWRIARRLAFLRWETCLSEWRIKSGHWIKENDEVD